MHYDRIKMLLAKFCERNLSYAFHLTYLSHLTSCTWLTIMYACCMNMHIHTYTHTHIHTYIHTHTHAQIACPLFCFSSFSPLMISSLNINDDINLKQSNQLYSMIVEAKLHAFTDQHFPKYNRGHDKIFALIILFNW